MKNASGLLYNGISTVIYNNGVLVYDGHCPKCGHALFPDASVLTDSVGRPEAAQNATCVRCGRVCMQFKRTEAVENSYNAFYRPPPSQAG
jgi:hypothetical protein